MYPCDDALEILKSKMLLFYDVLGNYMNLLLHNDGSQEKVNTKLFFFK